MGQAVNLTSLLPDEFKCCQVIFGSPEWSPNKMEQAWCRVHRIGQTEHTQVYFLYHKETIEEEMDALLYQKRQTIAKAQDRVEISRDDTQATLTYQEIATRILNKINKGQ
jgi:SNF2 family DNA or RNA helicase